MSSDHKSKFLLTNREREVFELLVQDKTTKDIAGQLFISEKTVRNHISNVMWFEILPSGNLTLSSFIA
jgi:LuxR family transcriptional regulator of spore coat protein